MMPVPTNRPRDTMLNAADAGPPVSGNTEAVGVAVALAEGLGEPPSDGNGVKGPPVVLAIGLPPGSTHTVTDSPPPAGLVVQPDALALGLEDCAKATEANSSAPSMDRPINTNTFLKGSPSVDFPTDSHVRHEASSGSRTGECRKDRDSRHTRPLSPTDTFEDPEVGTVNVDLTLTGFFTPRRG